jgi:F420H(2)-dependent quinone reductase
MDYMRAIDRLSPLFNNLTQGHTLLYRATAGLIGHRFPGGPPMLLLDRVGAKSGRRRTTPLAYLADGEDLVIVASKGGHPRHPAWFHNLRANPATTIQVGSERRTVRARVTNLQGARTALAEGCRGVRRLCRLSGAHRAGDSARHLGTAVAMSRCCDSVFATEFCGHPRRI